MALTVAATGFAQIPLCPSGTPQAAFPLQPGMAAATCFGGYLDPFNPGLGLQKDGFVLAVMDVRDPACNGAPTAPGLNWCAPAFHNEFPMTADSWTAGTAAGGPKLGQVFGLALDDDVPPNIYISATTVYGKFTGSPYQFGSGGAGGIYRIDGTTGAISLFYSLPIGEPSIGNICFDAASQRLYVTEMDEGLIYAIPKIPGPPVTTYDHGVVGRASALLPPISGDMPTTAFTKLGRRVWGVQAYAGRLYYAVYFEDKGRPSTVDSNEIWSIGLDAGNTPFDVSDIRKEFNVPAWGSTNHSNPVSSIAFSCTGKMLLAERTKQADFGTPLPLGSDSHQSRVLEYELAGSTWALSPRSFFVGDYQSQTNCSGGADYGCDPTVDCDPQANPFETVVATGDALNLCCKSQQFLCPACGPGGDAAVSYGIQIMPATGNTVLTPISTSILIDLDGVGGIIDKTQIGDVDVYCLGCQCMDVVTESIFCDLAKPPAEPGLAGTYTWNFCVTNRSGVTAHYVLLPFPEAVDHIIPLPVPLLDGQTTCLSAQLTLPPDVGFCFLITLADVFVEECCTIEVCIDVPSCECLQLTECNLVYGGSQPGGALTFTFDNLTGDTLKHLFLFPEPPGSGVTFSPEYFAISVGPYSSYTGTISTIIDLGLSPEEGTEVCFRISVHNAGLIECCSQVVCCEVEIAPASASNCCCADGGLPGGVGCDDASCMSIVCGIDPFCCQVVWDSVCCESALLNCEICSNNSKSARFGDFDGDGVVGASDLGILLGAWGGTGIADLDHSGVVDAVDLGALLGAWG
ncbi:MAG: hypothetical protein JNM94_13860 [Phycisphaerae bacterium]|nr:hypothetical protein [Phycisphaerae bacterium]